MRVNRSLLVLALLFGVVAATAISGQDRSECEQRRADADETIARSKDNWRDQSNLDARAREQILGMYELCKDEGLKGQYGPILNEVEERMAEHRLAVAKYYFDLYRTGKSTGLKGAESRFREIIEKFANYSKSDEVRLLLGRTYMFEQQQDNATATFTDLIRKYPASSLAYKAQVFLDRLAAEPVK